MSQTTITSIVLDANKKNLSSIGRKYGVIPDIRNPGDVQCKISPLLRDENFPDEFLDNAKYLWHVRDQGQVGRCGGMSATGQAMALRSKLGFDAIELAPDFAYWNARDIEGTTGEDAGVQIVDVQRGALKKGFCSLALHPMTNTSELVKPSDAAFADGLLRQNIKAMRVPQSEIGFKSVLFHGYTINLGILVYSSFESQDVAKTGIVPMPKRFLEKLLGGHAILAWGWKLINGHLYIACQNSWGVEWGDKGNFYLPIEFILSPRLTSDCWVVTESEHNGEFNGDNESQAA